MMHVTRQIVFSGSINENYKAIILPFELSNIAKT
jgi:hypothetical protein